MKLSLACFTSICLAILHWRRADSSPVDLELGRSEERSVRLQKDVQHDLDLTSRSVRSVHSRHLMLSAFNVQIFGEKKYADTRVRDILVKIFGRYDITFMQEIRDSHPPDSFTNFIEDLRRTYGSQINYFLSERLGRTSSKEQYAYIYNSSVVSVTDTYTYEDRSDHFERPPYCAHFTSIHTAVPDFAIIGVHTKPAKAEEEISYLKDVYEEVVKRFKTQNVIIMGDLNADCSYVTRKEWTKVGLRSDSKFTWLIDDKTDTTVGKNDCAYDRFVVAGETMKEAIVPGSAQPFRYDLAYRLDKELTEDVSDHYPIQLEMYGADKRKGNYRITNSASKMSWPSFILVWQGVLISALSHVSYVWLLKGS